MPAATTWAMSSWSNTKSSLFAWYGIVSSSSPAVGAQAGVVLGQVEPEGDVLDRRQESVADVLPARHAAGQRVAEEAAAEHEVVRARGDRLDERRDARRVVLVVGVEHHDDVGAGLERRVVARLLVAAVAPVLGVDDDVEAELAGDVDGLVRATRRRRG